MAHGFWGFDQRPATAEVFGPASYFDIFAASAPESLSLNEDARDGYPFYLVVLRGEFVPRRSPDAPSRPIATLLWSPTETEHGTQYGLRPDLPAAMSRLGTPHTISLD